MAASQSHGFLFEQFVRSRLQASQPDDRLRAPVANPTSFFDIQTGGLGAGIAGSIKTTAASAGVTGLDVNEEPASASIGLSDARRVWSWPYLVAPEGLQSSLFPVALRFIVGAYIQEGDYKTFQWVYEVDLVFDDATRKALFGNVSLGEVYAFHCGIGLEFFPLGQQDAARDWANSRKKALMGSLGAIDLNYKIDSKKQRRLQCTISLGKLLSAAKSWKVNSGPFSWDLPVQFDTVDKTGAVVSHYQARGPLSVFSPPRERNKKSSQGSDNS